MLSPGEDQLVLWGWPREQVLGEGTRAEVWSPGTGTSPSLEPLEGHAWRGQWTRAGVMAESGLTFAYSIRSLRPWKRL